MSCLRQCQLADLSVLFLQKLKEAVRLLSSDNGLHLSASQLAQVHFYCILAKAQTNAEMCHIRQTHIFELRAWSWWLTFKFEYFFSTCSACNILTHAYMLFYSCRFCQKLKGRSDCWALTMGVCNMGFANGNVAELIRDAFPNCKYKLETIHFLANKYRWPLSKTWRCYFCAAQENVVFIFVYAHAWQARTDYAETRDQTGDLQIFSLALSQLRAIAAWIPERACLSR